MIQDLHLWGEGGDKAAGKCYDAAEILKLMGLLHCVLAYERLCVCICERVLLISCSYLKSSGVNKVEWRWIMHYTLNNGTEERVWAVIEQNLLLSVKN